MSKLLKTAELLSKKLGQAPEFRVKIFSDVLEKALQTNLTAQEAQVLAQELNQLLAKLAPGANAFYADYADK